MKKFLKGGFLALILSLMLCLFTSCSLFKEVNTSEPSYWFSSFNKEYVKFEYDDDGTAYNEGNFDKHGTFWYFTVGREIKGTIYLRDDAQYGAYTKFTVNGETVAPKRGEGPYHMKFENLNLKKGDKIVIAVRWDSPVLAASHQREEMISLFGIKLEGEETIASVIIEKKDN